MAEGKITNYLSPKNYSFSFYSTPAGGTIDINYNDATRGMILLSSAAGGAQGIICYAVNSAGTTSGQKLVGATDIVITTATRKLTLKNNASAIASFLMIDM